MIGIQWSCMFKDLKHLNKMYTTINAIVFRLLRHLNIFFLSFVFCGYFIWYFIFHFRWNECGLKNAELWALPT
jgi:hypothetical protein